MTALRSVSATCFALGVGRAYAPGAPVVRVSCRARALVSSVLRLMPFRLVDSVGCHLSGCAARRYPARRPGRRLRALPRRGSATWPGYAPRGRRHRADAAPVGVPAIRSVVAYRCRVTSDEPDAARERPPTRHGARRPPWRDAPAGAMPAAWQDGAAVAHGRQALRQSPAPPPRRSCSPSWSSVIAFIELAASTGPPAPAGASPARPPRVRADPRSPPRCRSPYGCGSGYRRSWSRSRPRSRT